MTLHHATARRVVASLTAAVTTLLLASPAAADLPRDQQWYLDRINIDKAHAVSRGDGVLVGMFINSVNTGHPGLGGRVRQNKYVNFQGAVKDWPESAARSVGRDIDTPLAGLVVAQGGDNVLGVAPRAEVQPIDGPSGEKGVSQALRWLVDQGAKVIDMSGGFTVGREVDHIDGVRYALAKDVVVIMDATHARQLRESARTGVLVVGAIGAKDKPIGGLPDGPVNLSAPGDVFGMVGLTGEPSPGHQYGPMVIPADMEACAIVAGAAALVRAKYPQLNAASVIDRLLGTAQDLGPIGPDGTYGAGMVDAGAAVTADRPAVTANPLGDPGPPNDPGLLDRLGGGVLVIGGAVCCLLTVIVVVVVVLLVIRRRRR